MRSSRAWGLPASWRPCLCCRRLPSAGAPGRAAHRGGLRQPQSRSELAPGRDKFLRSRRQRIAARQRCASAPVALPFQQRVDGTGQGFVRECPRHFGRSEFVPAAAKAPQRTAAATFSRSAEKIVDQARQAIGREAREQSDGLGVIGSPGDGFGNRIRRAAGAPVPRPGSQRRGPRWLRRDVNAGSQCKGCEWCRCERPPGRPARGPTARARQPASSGCAR